ncbi:DNA polymerase nu [Manduca sexta]|nr:DNA polymerase nu [Manduca sexta]
MNNNNYFNFDYNYYEKQLSPFGKKVLQTLIQHYHKEQDSYKNTPLRDIPVQKKRILQFRDSHANLLTGSPKINSGNECSGNAQFNFTTTENALGLDDTLNSAKLLITIENNNDTAVAGCSIEDLLHTVNTNHANEKLCDFDNNVPHLNLEINIPQNNKEVVKEVETIAWDDIFDTELFVSQRNDEQCVISQSHEDRPFLFDYINNNRDDSNAFNVCNDTEFGNKLKTKRKRQIKSTDNRPKKPKKAKDNDNDILRKQKYTKTVKNWLSDINTKNHEDDEAITNNESNVVQLKSNDIIIEKTTAKTVKNKSKKIVQAQLANKDGVMKFRKPKNDINNDGKTIENSKVFNSDKPKEKRNKAKFVAPIKSQTPVKDITYEVHSVNGSDFKLYNEAFKIADQEHVVVLVYRNKFSQLNSHYTDDSCDIDGLMVNVYDEFYYFNENIEGTKEILTNILEGKVIFYEGKDVINYLASVLQIKINLPRIIDVKIGSSLLNPDDPPDNFSEVQKLLSFTPQHTIATECPLQKTAWYITLLKQCAVIMTDMLIQNSLWNVFVNIEMRLLPVVAAMERRGVQVDLEKLKSMENILVEQMKSVEQSCYKAAGRPFQINSPLQIRAILYDELQLDTKCNVKIRETLCKGAKSTSETMLRSLVSEHPLPRLILEYRHLHKAHATFLAGIAHHVKDGVVMPTWVQTAAVTGRIASNNPNLQAIPKAPFSPVMFLEDNHEEIPLLKFRSVYTSRLGYTLVAADFKHVECRVFAHAAADTSLLDVLRSRQDLFKVLAAKWLKKPEAEISSEDRERTKRIIYASLYGAGTRKLMDILNITYDQTLAITASFNRTFPSLKSFGRSVVTRCEQNGGRLSTICGRARQFKNISSEDFTLRSQAERQAVNFVVQGSAADLCKMAMIEAYEQLGKCCPAVEAHLLLQIHDELIWEVKDEHVDAVIVIIKQVMENCGRLCGMSVDLPVDLHTGKNWGEMSEYSVK